MNETNKRCDARDSCKIIESFEKMNAKLKMILMDVMKQQTGGMDEKRNFL